MLKFQNKSNRCPIDLTGNKYMDKIKCITFDNNAQDSLPQHIKDKMKIDRDNARKQIKP